MVFWAKVRASPVSVPPPGCDIPAITPCTAARLIPVPSCKVAVTEEAKAAIPTRVAFEVTDIPVTTLSINPRVAVQSAGATDPDPSARKTKSTTAAHVGAVGATVGATVVGASVEGAEVEVGAGVTHEVVSTNDPCNDSYPSTKIT